MLEPASTREQMNMLDTPTVKSRPAPATGDIEAILGVGRKAPSRFLRWRYALWAGFAAAAVVGVYVVWSLGGSRATVTYQTEPATRGNLIVIVTATGSAQPINQVNVSSELSGTIRKVLVDYNSPVKIGQPIAELDTDKLKATVENIRAKLDSAKAKVADAAASIEEKRADYDRKKALTDRQVGSVKDLELAKAAYERSVATHASALAEVRVVEADLALNEINLSKACICSPIDGVVLKRSVDPGQVVASSLQAPVLFVIAEDLRHMELQVDVDEADVGKVKIGQKATFSVDAYPDRKFPAEIRDVRYGSEVVQGVVTYKAILTIDNAELMIRPGMTATAQVVVQEVSGALLVPNAALRFAPPSAGTEQPGLLQRLFPMFHSRRPTSRPEDTGRSQKVWILRDGQPVPISVIVGSTDGRRTEIVEGEIASGQPVIVDAASNKR
jgi:HlyD family secretion protein